MDHTMEVVAPDGRRLHISEKAYRVIYHAKGYRPYSKPKAKPKAKPSQKQQEEWAKQEEADARIRAANEGLEVDD